MIDSYLKPDYLFETSWEVCNKMGGIHTVLSTRSYSLVQQFQDNIIFIGPDVWRESKANPEFIPDNDLFQDWKIALEKEGLRIKTGRWNVVGNPLVILVEFSSFVSQKNEILASFWESFKLDSLSGQWDYIESLLFGYAAGKVIESFHHFYLSVDTKVVAHFHEWMTASGALYLKQTMPQVATVFTTHATCIGRSIAGNNQPLYDHLMDYDGDAKARELHVVSKHSLEKIAAQNADCFTTVSDITAKECTQLLATQVDVVTPNGFEDNFVPQGIDFDDNRTFARTKLRQVAEALLGYKLSDDVLFIANSGRYEFKNKGIDVFMDGLKIINDAAEINREVVAFVLIPANTYGPRKDLIDKLNDPNSDVILQNPFLTHGLNDLGYDPIINKIQNIHLNNEKSDKVKLIFVPSYLKGDDGIFNVGYYEILIGMDLTIFPSYYEPWGYTPLESLAFSIPTVTTSLAGFGLWTRQFSKSIEGGIEVLERNDHNDEEIAQKIAGVIKNFAGKNPGEVEIIRARAKQVAGTAQWENLIKYYYKAYDLALKEVHNRRGKFMQTQSSREDIVPMDVITSNKPSWKKMVVKSKLPDRISALNELSRNLWWCWNYRAIELFTSIHPELWEKTKRNPIQLLEKVSYERLSELAKNVDFIKELDFVYEKFTSYINKENKPGGPKIAYFSMEYGLNNNLKIYSGGLGILAGDYLKEASDSNVNIIAIGLLYRFGYFTQNLSLNGEQLAVFDSQEFSNLPLEEVRNEEGKLVYVQVDFPGRTIFAKVWLVKVGRIPLYLLDTDHVMNQPHDREITHRLYGGDWENRLKQEILLGLGGIRLLNTLNIKCDLFHCNEGHAALINVQRLAELIHVGFTYPEALEIVRASSLFTTHTPVPAGHDMFDEDMFRVYMRHIPDKLRITWDDFMSLGREHPSNKFEKFSMSVLAAKTSQEMNGVSWLHGEVSKNMFQDMWKGYYPEELHVSYVTNGVHYGTWAAPEWQKFYEEEFDDDFLTDVSNKHFWERIYKVSDDKIWTIRTALRKKLLNYVRNRIETNMGSTHENPGRIIQVLDHVNEKTLTLGFARRFATYKRAHLLFMDIDRLSKILNNPDRPVQLLFAGKAHPADGGGQGLIKHIVEISRRPEFLGKIIFLENYDMELASKLVSGVDVWLNTPTRPLEASGTSGQKAELNGVLNFSVLDGWWYEGYVEDAGWALTEKQTFDNHAHQDELDAATIYSILENEIIPTFYDVDDKGVPHKWVQYIKNSIARIAPDYTTKRMIDDYLSRFYLKMLDRVKKLSANDYQKVHELALWKRKVLNSWPSVVVRDMVIPDLGQKELGIGDDYNVSIEVDLHQLSPSDIALELVFADATDDDHVHILHKQPFVLDKTEDSIAFYKVDYRLNFPGVFKFGIRMHPNHPDLPHKQDFAYVKWF